MEEIKITIPGGWDDVTIGQYQDIDYTNVTSLVCTLWNIDEHTATHMDMSMEELVEHLSFLTVEPNPNFKPELYGCKLLDIESLTVGDLEIVEKLCKDFRTNAHTIAAWMYRDEQSLEMRAEYFRIKMKVDELYGAAVHAGLTAGALVMPEVMASTFRKMEQITSDEDKLTEAILGIDYVESQKESEKLKNKIHGS